MGLGAINYSTRQDFNRSLFYDINHRYNQNKKLFYSEDLPSDPPLYDKGYIWAKKIQDEGYSKIKYSDYAEPYIIDIKFKEDKCIIFIDEHEYANGYFYQYAASEALKEFESKGYRIEAIQNKYGDYLWIRGKKNLSKIDLGIIYLSQIWFYLFWILSLIMPLLWLIRIPSDTSEYDY